MGNSANAMTKRDSMEHASDEYTKWRYDGYEKWDYKTVTHLRRTTNEYLKHLLPNGEIKIIVCGGTSHGKSSLINNCLAALSGVYSEVAKLGCGQEEITKQYNEFQAWQMEDGSVKKLPLTFADTRGFTDSRNHGVSVAAIKACILGKVVNGETINPEVADREWSIRKQHTHKVSYIFAVADATTIPASVTEMKPIFQNLRQIRDFSTAEGIPIAAFLTKCDNLDPAVKKDPSILHYSEAVDRSANLFSSVFGIPVSRVFPVVNYTDLSPTSNEMMIPTLLALRACLGDIVAVQEHSEYGFDRKTLRDQSKFQRTEKKDSDIIKSKDRRIEEKLENSLKKNEKNAKFIIWLGTDLAKEYTKVFVCLYQGVMHKRTKSYKGISIYYKDSETPSRPIEHPHNMPINSEFSLSHEDVELLHQAIEKHGLALFKQHSNLEAITGSSFTLSKSKGYIALPSVVLYCQVKGIAPIGEDAFPTTLTVGHLSIKVDVREGYLRQGMLQSSKWCRTDWHKKLCMGISIGVEHGGAGTLGPFVKISDRDIGFLTCAHVIQPDATDNSKLEQSVEHKVYQPADGESHPDNEKSRDERYCGEVSKIVFNPHICDPINGLPKDVGVDAALVTVMKKRDVDFRSFPFIPRQDLNNAGFDLDHPPEFEYGSGTKYPLQFKDVVGERVIKYGRTTGLTKGTLLLGGTMVRMQDAVLKLPKTEKKVLMKGQYIVERVGRSPFFDLGDSGSGVFILDKENKLTCIGLAIGCLDQFQTVVTPIEYVLKALGLKLDSMELEQKMDVQDMLD